MTWLNGANKPIRLGNGLTARWMSVDRDTGALWQSLQARADGSVFQSWVWTGCLFAERFPRPRLLRVDDEGGDAVALGLFNRAPGAGLLRQYHLASSGDADWDAIFIEHNGPLVARDRPEARAAWYRAALIGHRRAVLHCPGIAAADGDARASVCVIDAVRRAPFRDLARLRAQGVDLLDRVSANTRQQMKRALRQYRDDGEVMVERAATVGEAQEWLVALGVLHQATWQARGKTGAFAGDGFRRFHQALVTRGVADDVVDVLRIAAGERVIGYLYNFVWRGTVSAYQSGFDYRDTNPHEKPGLVCHLAAIRYYQARGLDRYDFLAGDDRYKRSLADGETELRWVRMAPRLTLADAALRGRATLARGYCRLLKV